MALTIGLEPTTNRLTADCSAIELSERQLCTLLARMQYHNHSKTFLQEKLESFLISAFLLILRKEKPRKFGARLHIFEVIWRLAFAQWHGINRQRFSAKIIRLR